MRRILSFLFVIFPAVLSAAEETGVLASDADKKRIFSMLPNGSQLKGVMLPRYDENRKLVGVLKSDVMRLVNSGEVAGERIAIAFYNDDQSQRGRIDLKQATFFEAKEMLVAKEAVRIEADGMIATGTALYYHFRNGEGFLQGPGTTTIPQPLETTMKTPPASMRATVTVSLSLLMHSLSAAPPEAITAEQKAELQTAATSAKPEAAASSQTARNDLREVLKKSEEATRAATEFLEKADLLAAQTGASTPVADAKPLETTTTPDGSVITYDGGMHFDMDEGYGTFLKNVTANTPDFSMSGADEVKVFFSKKPADDAKKAAEPKGDQSSKGFGDLGGKMGDIERIVATGAILIKQKNPKPGEEPVLVSGGLFSYNVKTGDIVITGRYPWFTRGSMYVKSLEPNVIIRIDKNFKTTTEGKTEAGGTLPKRN